MKNVYIVSDSIGETAERLVKAVGSQFTSSEFKLRKFTNVKESFNLKALMDDAVADEAIIVFTTVIEEIRSEIIMACNDLGLHYVDIMGPALQAFQGFVNETPVRSPGIMHKLDENYFDRIKAVEFAVKYDDGKDYRGIRMADIVLLGISRTSKTPLSMYLAHKGLKVANVPLFPEMSVPGELDKVDPKKIIGLKTSARVLMRIREQRAIKMGLSPDSNYATMERIKKELEHAQSVMDKYKCEVIDVSDKAIEEVATIIMEIYEERFGKK